MINLWNEQSRKARLFGVIGAVGCLLGAIVGEPLWWAGASAPPPTPQVDVLFLLDITGSMQPVIDGVRDGIVSFADELSSRELDSRVGLVAFRDRAYGEEAEILQFAGSPFTSDAGEFRLAVSRLRANGGGGDGPESSLDALSLGTQQPFRPQAIPVLVLITDDAPKVPDKQIRSIDEAVAALRQSKVAQLHLVVRQKFVGDYTPLHGATKGEVFLLDDIASGREKFSNILPTVGQRIAETALKGMQSTSGHGPSSLFGLLVVTCLWTGLLATGVSLALIAGQNHYTHRPLFAPQELVTGIAGGLAAGAAAGAVGQILYLIASSLPAMDFVARVVGWGLLGGLVAWGLAFFIPNLPAATARKGGAIGGCVAAIGFSLLAALAGDTSGRWLAAAILGFAIGLMIALLELVTRTLWLEVRYGQRELVNISLGSTPVTIGSNSRQCTVYARDARPLAFQYRVEEGKVKCVDYATESTSEVPVGDQKQIGAVLVTVRSGQAPAGSGDAGPSAIPVRAAPPPPPMKSRNAVTAPAGDSQAPPLRPAVPVTSGIPRAQGDVRPPTPVANPAAATVRLPTPSAVSAVPTSAPPVAPLKPPALKPPPIKPPVAPTNSPSANSPPSSGGATTSTVRPFQSPPIPPPVKPPPRK